MYDPIELKSLTPLHDHILVTDMQFDQKTTSAGIIIQRLDSKVEGVHPRWGKVYAVGAEQKEIKVGQYIMVAHGRWTRGIRIKDEQGEHVVRRVDNNDILLVSDEPVTDENIGQGYK